MHESSNHNRSRQDAGLRRRQRARCLRRKSTVSASALSQFGKSRSSGTHYSSGDAFPSVAGTDGVGRTADGRRVYFVLPDAPYGALAEKSPVDSRQCVLVPDGLDSVTTAAIANPGMSAWAALVERARLQPDETVLVNGATGTAGRLAVQLAKHLGAGRVIGTSRNESELQELLSLGADLTIPFTLGASHVSSIAERGTAFVAICNLADPAASNTFLIASSSFGKGTLLTPLPIN